MSDDVLLRFLSNNLINVGGDDAKLEKLRAAANDLATALKKMPSKAAAFALIAFDPRAPSDDPIVCEALYALKNCWATYVNTFAETPTTVVRAMLLDALERAAADDDRIGVAFVASARNALPFMEGGAERTIWAQVVSDIEARVDARAEAEWAMPAEISVPAMIFETPALGAPKLKVQPADRENSKEAFRAAVGPQSRGNVPTNGNSFVSYAQQHNPQWVTEFGDRMAGAVADVIDSVISKATVAQPDLSKPFGAMKAAVTNYVETSLKAVSGATAGLQRRTNLLWWKEALFSPSAQVSYRDLPPAAAAAQMAFDLYQQVPTFSPASVSAFLFEAVLRLPLVEEKVTFRVCDLVNVAQTYDSLAPLRSAGADLMGPPAGRGPVLALIAHPDAPAATRDHEFQRLTGVPVDTELTLPAWATWVFRELQAVRATASGVRPPPRSRKG